jgi:transposase-like protein
MATKSKNERKHYAENVKRQAILDLDSGNYTIAEVMSKHCIITHSSLKDWGQLYSVDPQKYKPKARIPRSTRLRAVNEILSGYMTAEESATKYNITLSGIKSWIREYSEEVLSTQSDVTLTDESSVEHPMTKEEENSFKEMERLLKAERLKVLGLETMIDIAEKTFKLDIRKKFGSKQ